ALRAERLRWPLDPRETECALQRFRRACIPGRIGEIKNAKGIFADRRCPSLLPSLVGTKKGRDFPSERIDHCFRGDASRQIQTISDPKFFERTSARFTPTSGIRFVMSSSFSTRSIASRSDLNRAASVRPKVREAGCSFSSCQRTLYS